MIYRLPNLARLQPALAWLIVTGCGLALPNDSRAAVDFVFNFTDAAGVGFNAAGQTGADRRAGLDIAAGVLETYLADYTATITIDVNGSVTNDTTLASASSNFNAAFPGNGFGTRGDVMIKILGGADPNPAAADGTVNWNFEDFSWESGSDFQAGELDLQSTATHELAHALGFASSISQAGAGIWGDAAGAPTGWFPFDQFVADSTGSIIDGGTFSLSLARWNTASVGGTGPTNGLLFNGLHAMLANGGNVVPLYSPTTWSDGSSGSHLDTDFFTGANAQMMNHSGVAQGLDIRALSPIEIGVLKDIGYSLIAVPEPGPGMLLMIGAASAVATRRRRAE